MPLQAVAPDLWIIDHPLSIGGLALGTRTTIVRLGDGRLALLSPGPLDGDGDTAAITALGAVAAIVAPNLMHHLFLTPARGRFPDALLYAPPALARKRRDLRPDQSLPASPDPAALACIPIAGMPRLDETAFVHLASRTLVLTDLAFNIRPPAPFVTRAFMRLNGGFDRFGPSRICRALVRDRAATRASMEALLAHDFDRIIVAHGHIVPSGGKELLRASFSWLF
jgi:hypothetical protein